MMFDVTITFGYEREAHAAVKGAPKGLATPSDKFPIGRDVK
jgi:hypothetical protein